MTYRKKCLAEKDEECVICGSTSDIAVHHLDGDRSNDDLDNLVPTCRSCHRKIHAGKDGYEEYTEQLLPRDERTVRVAWDMTPSMKNQLELIKMEEGVSTTKEAVERAVSEYNAVYSRLQDLRYSAPEETVERQAGSVKVSNTVEALVENFEQYHRQEEEVIEEAVNAIRAQLGEGEQPVHLPESR